VGECDFDGEEEVIATEVKVKEKGACCGTKRHLLMSERIISFWSIWRVQGRYILSP
jgi:hypothetical protein